MKVIKQLSGYSSSRVFLMENQNTQFVRKHGNIERNLERYRALENTIPLPKILSVGDDYYDMEYVFGMDMRTYLTTHSSERLINFIAAVLDTISKDSRAVDYTGVYQKRLTEFRFEQYDLEFNSASLLEALPKLLPRSQYLGDLSLDNIIYSIKDETFVIIDPLTTVYDSYIFDIAKLRQDTVCKWFIRHDVAQLESQLEILSSRFQCSNPLLILMLMRVLPYAKNEFDKEFLTKEINKLWNSM